ncbi:unnamed protein product [Heligmosomoides polygyrus]|uniref:Endo/exonuclease/phosphatase domain-containing protein n=1 Tax=Heligmosomoides polygyrus TaxID=6339 RepID=A0A183FTR7_HELPZ|nr:unnamed protein product [Heligmosomoides polygyrus]
MHALLERDSNPPVDSFCIVVASPLEPNGIPTYKCNPFNDSPCSGDLEWTAGLMEVGNDSQNTVKFACCSYGGMKKSHLIRTMLLGENDRYEGGLVQIPNQTASFDLIKEVRKSVGSYNKINYVVTIHRLQCDHEPMDKSDDAAMPRRSKRRLSSEKKLAESDDDWNEGNDRRQALVTGRPTNILCHIIWLMASQSSRDNARRPRELRALAKPGKCKVRIATLNVGTLTGRSCELVEAQERRRVDFCAVQETKWSCRKSRDIGRGMKAVLRGSPRTTSGVGVIISERFRDSIVGVELFDDRLMKISP